MSKGKHGKDAEPLVVPVPPGTVVYDDDTNEMIADLTNDGQRAIIAHGGKGGRGNIRFATSRNPAPNLSENGEPGEERNIRVELKVIADVGLVGFPSVGKSTLLSVVTAARPKIAAYHFTTLTPNLGVVDTEDGRSFVMADLPGLIEGAHEGVGLGHQFLRHVERTRLIVHIVDMASLEGRDPFTDYQQINEELVQYDQRLADKKQIVVANKMDMPDSQENLSQFKQQVDEGVQVYPVSALTKDGLKELLYGIADTLETIPKTVEMEDVVIIQPEKVEEPFSISRDDDGTFVLSGNKIERMFKMTDFSTDEGVQRFARRLRHLGVDEALRKRGAEDGDTIKLLDFEFEFIE